MAYREPRESAAGTIREIAVGSGDPAVVVGGENALPFYLFDGAMPNTPAIAMEVFDVAPEGWPTPLSDALGDVMGDPVTWAKACVEKHGARLICLQLAGTDPGGANRTAEEAAATAVAVADAAGVPLIVYGSGNADKDAEVLKAVAAALNGRSAMIGPATEDNYKAIAAVALAYGHGVVAETPIDVNMAKQLNILITQLGLPADRILIDPSTGAVGYGLEYSYTVMERLRLAALIQNDDMTRMPLICNLGKEAWRAKEAKATEEEEPAWGDAAKRGVLWEAMTALSLTMGGADVLVMRHPEAIALVGKAFEGLSAQ